jgi:phosphonate transport system ATP-binding protein
VGADAPAVLAQQVTKRYPNGALGVDGVSLAVPSGSLVGVVGPSGAGKTTFFRLCNGSIRPSGGRLEVLGVPMATVHGRQLRRLRRRVAIVYQNHNLVTSLSVLHNVLLGRLGGVSVPEALWNAFLPSIRLQREAYDLLDHLGIGDKLYTRVDELSGGQQQRVAVARALIQQPDLLLADEPVASVDKETATAILDLLAEVCRERQTTVLVSLHQTEYVERYCQQAVELRSGRIERATGFSTNGATRPQDQFRVSSFGFREGVSKLVGEVSV